MAPRTLRLLLPLLASLLAGCGEPAPSAPATPDGPGVVTDPDDYSYLQNGTDGSGWHVHDYWRGQDEVLVLDAQTGTAQSTCTGCDEGMVLATLRPEPDHIVPQGAAWVNVTVDVRAEGTPDLDHYELWVKTARDGAEVRVGPVEDGETVAIATTNEQDDPPHHVLSLWRFQVRAATDDGTASFTGSVALRATAARGHEIPPYPPHPDLWGGQDESPLLDDGRELVLQYQTDGVEACWFGCLDRFAPAEGAVVPHDAAEVVVRLTHAAAGVPTVALAFHGADTWDLQPVEAESRTPTETVWRIPLSATRGDSPYAQQSLWEFQLAIDQPTPARAWAGDYRLQATAHRTAG